MKKIYFFSLLLITFLGCSAQVIECSPDFPTAVSSNIVITFHADQGTAGLKDYNGDIYAHTGVVYKGTSSWANTVAEWTENLDKCKLEKTSTDTYTLNIGCIADFYGISSTQAANVEKLAFVFRSSDGSKEGKGVGGTDIFQTIYENTLSVNLNLPTSSYVFVDEENTINISAVASESSLFKLYDQSELINQTSTSSTSYNFSLTATSGSHKILLEATNGSETATTSFTYIVRGESPIGSLPSGVKRGVNVVSDNSVTFVLYAPNKSSAYVTGSFNDWNVDADCQMTKTSDGKYFYKTISNLDKNTEYIYQYLVDETIRIADPYTEKISDPDNDKYISSSVFPNLIQYPSDFTTGIASTFKISKDTYTWKCSSFEAPEAKDLIIYELLVRDFTTEGSIKAATNSLDYLQTLGINAIELMPISEFEGNNSWGYNPSFYFAADKAYGTVNDYKEFIDQCHQRGIAVILDIVLNHSFGQSPFVKLYYDSSTGKVTDDNPWYNVDSPNTVYSWGYDFNHESDDTKQLVDSVMHYWLTEFKFDGMRFDFTKGFTNTPATNDAQCSAYDESRINILKRIYDKIKSINPKAYMICEHLTDNSEEKVLANYGIMLWGNMNYSFCQSTMGYSEGCDISGLSASLRGFDNPMLVGYAESHDEERMMFKALRYGNSSGDYSVKDLSTALQRMKCAAAMLLSVPGPKMIWQFGELGYDYSINYDIVANTEANEYRTNPKPVPTGYKDDENRNKLYNFYVAMNKLRSTVDAFKNGSCSMNVNGLVKTIIRKSANSNAIVVANFDVKEQTKTIPFDHIGSWYEVVNGETLEVETENKSFSLQPGEVKIFVDQKVDIIAAIEGINQDFAINVYPNPCTTQLKIESDAELYSIEVYSLSGAVYTPFSKSELQSGILDVSSLTKGFYIFAINTSKGLIVKKVIITK